jgi:hypothetical protein
MCLIAHHVESSLLNWPVQDGMFATLISCSLNSVLLNGSLIIPTTHNKFFIAANIDLLLWGP